MYHFVRQGIVFGIAGLLTWIGPLAIAEEGHDDHHNGTIDGEASAGDRVMVHTTFDPGAVTAGSFKLSFHLYDKVLKTSLNPRAIESTHGAPVHVILYDASLNEYRHVHPTFEGGSWQAEVDLPVNGTYHLWTQGKIKADGALWSSATEFVVVDGEEARPVLATLPDVTTGVDGISRVELLPRSIAAGTESLFTLAFDRLDGTPVELSPYLFAAAHLLIVDTKGDTLVHAHPMEAYGNLMEVHAWFPHPGSYRIWVEFNDGDFHRTIPLSINVQ